MFRLIAIVIIFVFFLGARVCQEDYEFGAQTTVPTPTPATTPTPTPVDDDDDDEDNELIQVPTPTATPDTGFLFLRELSALGGKENIQISPPSEEVIDLEAARNRQRAGGKKDNWLGRGFIDDDPLVCDELLEEFKARVRRSNLPRSRLKDYFDEWKLGKGIENDCDAFFDQHFPENI